MGRNNGGVKSSRAGTKSGTTKKVTVAQVENMKDRTFAMFNSGTKEGQAFIVSEWKSMAKGMSNTQLQDEHVRALKEAIALDSAKDKSSKSYKNSVKSRDAIEFALRQEMVERIKKKKIKLKGGMDYGEWYAQLVVDIKSGKV